MVCPKLRFFLAAGCILALSPNAVAEESVISVTLRDNGVTASTDKTRAGKISFEVKNDSKERTHSFLVVPMKEDGSEMLLNEDEVSVYGYARYSICEIYDIDPGITTAVALDLRRGTYILTSIRHGPYLNGMWTAVMAE